MATQLEINTADQRLPNWGPSRPLRGSVAWSRSVNESTLDLGSKNPGNLFQRNFDK